MGRAVRRAAEGRFDIIAPISRENPDYERLKTCDAVIDFSTPDGLMRALPHLPPQGCALVSGTTGLSVAQEQTLSAAADNHAILRSGNFSVGIHLLGLLTQQAAATLGAGWDIEILEMHHRDKVDAPSGTALMLGDAAARGRGVELDDVSTVDRTGKRRSGDIGFSVLRGGGVYGDHEVRLVNQSQMITLGHRALNRDVFADGALDAAEWLIGQKPGLYTMGDMLNG